MLLKSEELISEPKECLHQVFKFLFNVNDINGTVIERRIGEVLKMEKEATQAYNLKEQNSKYA